MRFLANIISNTLKNNIQFLKYSSVFTISYLIWWAVYYPGIFTPDSIDQLNQAINFSFINSSPYLYSLIMSFFIHIFTNFGLMSLFQVGVFIAIASSILNFAYKKGVKSIYLNIMVLFLVLVPYIPLYNITLWKDVLYTAILLATFWLAYYLYTKKHDASNWMIVALASLTALLPMIRFNGIIFIFLIPITFLLARPVRWLKLLLFLTIEIGLFICLTFVLPDVLSVKPAPLMKESIYLKMAGAVISSSESKISKTELNIFQKVLPAESWKALYSCTTVDYLFYTGVRDINGLDIDDPIFSRKEDVNNWHRAVISASVRNPKAIIKDRLCIAESLLGFRYTRYKYENRSINDYGAKYIDPVNLVQPQLKKYFNFYISVLSLNINQNSNIFIRIGGVVGYFIWSSVVPLSLTLIMLIISIYKKLFGLMFYSGFMVMNIIFTILVVPATDFRYIYPLHVLAIFLPILYLIEIRYSGSR